MKVAMTYAPRVSAYLAFARVDALCMWPFKAQKRCSETPEMSTRVAQPLMGDSWCACGMALERGKTYCTMCCGGGGRRGFGGKRILRQPACRTRQT
jgi:hypothetical protein